MPEFFRYLQKFYDSVDLVVLIKACNGLEYPRIPLLLLVQAFLGLRTLRTDGHHSEKIPVANGLVAGLHRPTTWPERCFIVPCMTTSTDVPSLLFRNLWMISRCTRKESQDMSFSGSANQPPSCSIRLASSKLICLPQNLVSWPPRGASASPYAQGGRIRALVFPQSGMRENWVLTSLLVAGQSPLRRKEHNEHSFEQGAFGALPKSTRVPVASCSTEEHHLRAHMFTRFGAFRPHP